jgi:hydroxymethylglutaryl-CoA lyase
MFLPKHVDITEVCPRDGFQNVKEFIPTEKKIAIIKGLIDAGFKKIEAASFVSPKWVPQMADADEVMAAVKGYAKEHDVILAGLALNVKGVENALNAGVDEIHYVLSVSEIHSLKNSNKTNDQAFEQFAEVVKIKGNKKLNLGLATSFGCPFGEEIPAEKVVRFAVKSLEMGADDIDLADTIGVANPLQVDEIVNAVKKEISVDKICMHLHDTRGLALANALAAMMNGVYKFETAAGGLGGCPFAPGASGNSATEDMLFMMDSMGIETGIKEDKLYETIKLIKNNVNTCLSSHMSVLSPVLK